MEEVNPMPKGLRRMSKTDLADRLSALQSNIGQNSSRSPHETEFQAVLHELEVYQIELEMQVRELNESRQSLEESHHRYVNLYDFAPIGYITMNAQGIIKEINLTAAGMLGVERRWLVGRSLSPWVLPTDLPIFRTHLKQCRDEDEPVRSTFHFLNRGKFTIPVELATTCFIDSTSNEKLFRTAITDITGRRKAEADLDRFFNVSTDLLCLVNLDGFFQRVNPAFEKILGYMPQELVNRSCFDFMHPEDRSSSRGVFFQAQSEGDRTDQHKNRFIKKDGGIVWLSWSGIASGDVFFCSARDVTSQVEQEKCAKNQYQWLEEMVRKIPLPISILEEKTGDLVMMSETCENLFQDYPKSVSEMSHSDFFCANSQGKRLPSEKWPRIRAARGEQLNQEPFFLMTRNGMMQVQISSRTIPEKYNQPARIVIAIQDVTDLKDARQSLGNAVVKLEQERDLREGFVATLTHDLRNPLTAARMLTELLVKGHIDPKLPQRVIKNIDRVSHMIEDLLDANRIRSGEKLPIKRSQFDLKLLLQETVEELSIIYGNRFIFEAPDSTAGKWSRQGLRRVIENLVSNAVKYGDPSRPITIQLRSNVIDSKEQAIISVQNYGNPIPKEEQLTLFDQFRRAAFAQESGQKGWGLGLTLVRGILESHGGSIQVESNAETGTTFLAVLPKG